MCFGHWNGDQGAVRWARSFGTPRRGTLLVQFCQEVLQWYPAFAGRYVKDWNQAYVPCKQRELERLREAGKDESHYYGPLMWRSCRPAALAAHDAATGVGGPAAELTPPYGLRNLYGAQQHGRILLAQPEPEPEPRTPTGARTPNPIPNPEPEPEPRTRTRTRSAARAYAARAAQPNRPTGDELLDTHAVPEALRRERGGDARVRRRAGETLLVD